MVRIRLKDLVLLKLTPCAHDEVEAGADEVEGGDPSQVKRLSFIEARLFCPGELRSSDVARRFSRAQIRANRDLALCKEIAPDNLMYEFQAKTYLSGEKFWRITSRTLERVMYLLRSGLGDGLPHSQGLPTAAVESLSAPRLGELAVLTRAIYHKQVLEVSCVSLSSGKSIRQIVPHAPMTAPTAGFPILSSPAWLAGC